MSERIKLTFQLIEKDGNDLWVIQTTNLIVGKKYAHQLKNYIENLNAQFELKQIEILEQLGMIREYKKENKQLKEKLEQVKMLEMVSALKLQELIKYRIKNPVYYDDTELDLCSALQDLMERSKN